MRTTLASLILLSGFTTRIAFADDRDARADALFAEGQKLMATDVQAGCAKLEAAYQLNSHAIGILLNAALCEEKLGRVASAVERFQLAHDMATEQHLADHLAAASEHLLALRSRVPYVAFMVSEPQVTLLVDEKPIQRTSYGRVALDPGSHRIVVTAPGSIPYESTLQIAEGEKQTVVIPQLEHAISRGSSRRRTAVIVGGSGLALGATGVVLSLVARSRYNSANCHDVTLDGKNARQCDAADDYQQANRALTLGNVSFGIGIVGLAAIGVGTYLWLSAPRTSERSVAVVPQVDANGAGIAAVGRF